MLYTSSALPRVYGVSCGVLTSDAQTRSAWRCCSKAEIKIHCYYFFAIWWGERAFVWQCFWKRKIKPKTRINIHYGKSFGNKKKITSKLKHNRNLRIHQMQLMAIKRRTYSGDESGEAETVLLSWKSKKVYKTLRKQNTVWLIALLSISLPKLPISSSQSTIEKEPPVLKFPDLFLTNK